MTTYASDIAASQPARADSFDRAGRWRRIGHLWVHIVLCLYAVIALFPIALILINSIKSRDAIFENPLAFPSVETFSLIGFRKVLTNTNFVLFFGNSLVVT